jgi:hypothetical protein
MKAKFACAAMVVAALGVCQAAQASDIYSLTPTNSTFSATGQASVTGSVGSYSCSVAMSGTTGNASGKITNLTFSGAAGCENVIAMGLPWKVRPISTHKLQITHVALMYPGLGKCGPNQISANLSQGAMTINDRLPSKTGICAIKASLNSSPVLAISK